MRAALTHLCRSLATVVCLLVVPCLLTPAAAAASAAVRADQAEDRAAIDALVASLSEAWNRGDAEAFGAHFAEDGFFTNIIGMRLYSHKDFVAQHARIFSTIYKGSHNTLTATKIKFIRPDVAVVDVESVLTGSKALPAGVTPRPDGSIHTALQMVLAKQPAGWEIESFHNVVITTLPPA